jgi:hypothetical protein
VGGDKVRLDGIAAAEVDFEKSGVLVDDAIGGCSSISSGWSHSVSAIWTCPAKTLAAGHGRDTLVSMTLGCEV